MSITPAMLDALVEAWRSDEGWGSSPAIQARAYRIIPTAPESSRKVVVAVEPESWWGQYHDIAGKTNKDAVGPIPPGHALCSGYCYFHVPMISFHLRQDLTWNEAIAAMEGDKPEPFEEARFG